MIRLDNCFRNFASLALYAFSFTIGVIILVGELASTLLLHQLNYEGVILSLEFIKSVVQGQRVIDLRLGLRLKSKEQGLKWC